MSILLLSIRTRSYGPSRFEAQSQSWNEKQERGMDEPRTIDVDALWARCQIAGLRPSASRLAILKLLCAQEAFKAADEIYAIAQTRGAGAPNIVAQSGGSTLLRLYVIDESGVMRQYDEGDRRTQSVPVL
jgi:hypothetical protein